MIRHILAAESWPAGRFNEDRIAVAGPYLWVLDGATGLRPGRSFPGDSDAAWFAEAWSSALMELAPRSASPQSLIVAAHEHVSKRIDASLRGPLAQDEYPALALAFVRVADGRLDACNIGDCSIIVRDRTSVRRLGSSEVDRFDALALDVFTSAVAEGQTHAGALRLARSQILRNRQRANCRDGYWVVDPSARWLDHVQNFSMAFDTGGDLLVASDGFMRILDPYGISTTLENVLDSTRDMGAAAILDRIRALEADDPDCRAFPRLKPVDDASVVMAAFASAEDR